MELESSRLVFSKFAKKDEPDYLHLVTNKELMKFIHNGAMSELDAKARFEVVVANNQNSPLSGFWAARSRESDALIGFVKIAEFEGDKVEVGYAVIPTFWGKGYASEMLQAMIDFCNYHFAQVPLYGLVQSENLVSIKLLEKFKFHQYKEEKQEHYTLLYFVRD
ncbi:GNAT family N-acetyltransferase [Fulvivirgaceae bacterium LMO-SS25]